MSTARRVHYSYEDYLRALDVSEIKLEFCDGIIYAMAGGTPAHAALGAAAIRLLGQLLSNRCTVYSSDLKILVDTTGLAAFPDASVVCGTLETPPIDVNAASNPRLLVEVTSPSTEDFDRGEKLSHYKQIPSLRAVLFVSHRSPRVTLIQRTDTAWEELEFASGQSVSIVDPKLELSVDDLYAGITLARQA